MQFSQVGSLKPWWNPEDPTVGVVARGMASLRAQRPHDDFIIDSDDSEDSDDVPIRRLKRQRPTPPSYSTLGVPRAYVPPAPDRALPGTPRRPEPRRGRVPSGRKRPRDGPTT